MRGSFIMVGAFALNNILRLGSNLLLARLLFPEAFGLMALVTVLLVGLSMFSDIGLTPAIQRSKRGDDPAFLNTAWTAQVLRGVFLCLVAAALAWPMAQFYGEPILFELILVAALSPLILGLASIRVEYALRHMMVGRTAAMELSVQTVGISVMLALAWATGSVWALVIGNLATSVTRVLYSWLLLPGPPGRPGFDRAAASELFGYGKWVFLSTIAGFFLLQSDKLILGRFLTMADLGIYNIAFFLASFPLILGRSMTGALFMPVYRETPPGLSPESDRRLRRIRAGLTVMLIALCLPLVLAGHWLVELLYDPRYAAAGPLLILLALAQMPQLIGVTYDQAALAGGDSRGFFVLSASRACFTVIALLYAVPAYGPQGAALALFLTGLLSYPLQVRLALRHRAWDGLHDGAAAVAVLALLLIALALHGEMLL